MVLFLEVVDVTLEGVNYGLDILQVMLLKSLKLFHSWKKLLEFCNTTAKQIKLTKNLSWWEIELLSFWNILKTFFCELVLFYVSIMEI
jgi:hypothetical protein